MEKESLILHIINVTCYEDFYWRTVNISVPQKGFSTGSEFESITHKTNSVLLFHVLKIIFNK